MKRSPTEVLDRDDSGLRIRDIEDFVIANNKSLRCE